MSGGARAAIALILCGLPLAASADTDAGGFVRVRPDALVWRDPLRLGMPMAFVVGDPRRPGLYVLRVRFPPGSFSRPHSHRETRYITVLKGTWYMGTGAHFDPALATAMPAGSFAVHPAGQIHWDGAKDEPVELQIMGYGPSTTVPFDAPGRQGE